jgi:hypothetical protein
LSLLKPSHDARWSTREEAMAPFPDREGFDILHLVLATRMVQGKEVV